MKIEITSELFLINDQSLEIKKTEASAFLAIINANYRKIELDNDSIVYIYDDLGIKFWEKENVVTEFQIALDKSVNEYMPQQAYQGELSYKNKPIVDIRFLNHLTAFDKNLEKDMDNFRFGMNTYKSFNPKQNISFRILDMNVSTISIT
jgi:hypothetical protein